MSVFERDHRLESRFEISPFEIVEALRRSHRAVDDVAAFISPSSPHHERGEADGVAVLLHAGRTPSSDELRTAASALVPARWLPQMIVYVDELPMNPSGLCSRHDLVRCLPPQDYHDMWHASMVEACEYGGCRVVARPRLLASPVVPDRACLPAEPSPISELLAAVLDAVQTHTHDEHVAPGTPLMDAGLNSINAIQLALQLEQRTGVALPATLIFRYSTAEDIARHLHSELTPALKAQSRVRAGAEHLVGSERLLAHAQSCVHIEQALPRSLVSCSLVARLAGTPCTACLRALQAAAGNAVRQVPSSRWRPSNRSPLSARHGAFVVAAQCFDAAFFRISPGEMHAMDPQQRLLLEIGYEATHGAALRRNALVGREIGIFVGLMNTDFAGLKATASVYAATGTQVSVASGRLAFVLGTQGPCASVDTACSSALVALDAAVLSLHTCHPSLAAAANLLLQPSLSLLFTRAGMLSADGRSKTFDTRANGYVRGEGVGAAALNAKDSSVTLGRCAVRADGKSASLTAPNGMAQARLISAALAASNVGALDNIETHATGTSLGDPTEMGGLERALGSASVCVGGAKANVGHTEPVAGLVGLLALLQLSVQRASCVNAQLCVLNVLLIPPLCRMGALTSVQSLMLTCTVAGVSSFGYSGTIAHALLAFGSQGAAEPLSSTSQTKSKRSPPSLAYRRHAFQWHEMGSASGVGCTHLFSLCWPPLAVIDVCQKATWTLLVRPLPDLTAGPDRLTKHNERAATPRRHAVVILLDASVRAAPLMHGTRLTLALAQRLMGHMPALSRVFVLTCGWLTSGGGYAASDAAHGGAWGFARVLRLEHPALRTQSADVLRDARVAASLALTAPMAEAEMAWRSMRGSVARLRACEEAPTTQGCEPACGVYTITGGLGGLGLRASSLLVESGASAVFLTSCRGHVARNGQGLEAQLQLMSSIASIVACDSVDARDATVMLCARSLTGVLHAAGRLRDRMLRSMFIDDISASFAPKALAASHIHVATAGAVFEVLALFSSVASTFGNIGQANYAAANAYLDCLAARRRLFACFASSLQIPVVSNTGMASTVFSAEQLDAAGAISPDMFATYLSISLAPARGATGRTQALLSSVALEAITPPNLCESAQRNRISDSIIPTVHASRANVHVPLQFAHVEAAVLRVVRELMGEAADSLTAESPLMEAGVDSLAATELSSRLRSVTGVALSPTLVFEQPTPRIISSHLLGQLAREASAVDSPSSGEDCAQAPRALPCVRDRWPRDRGGEVMQLRAACGDAYALRGVPRAQWVLEEAVEARVLFAAQAACEGESGYVLIVQRFNANSFASPPPLAGTMDSLFLELGHAFVPDTSQQRARQLGGEGGDLERPDWAFVRPVWARSSVCRTKCDGVSAAVGRMSLVLGQLAFGNGGGDDAHAFRLARDSPRILSGNWGVVAGYELLPATRSPMFASSSRLLLPCSRHALAWRYSQHLLVQQSLPSLDGPALFRSPAVGLLCALVAEHVVRGRVVFPGTGHLELARAATAMALCSVYFLQPLTIEAPNIFVECAVSGGRFDVRSGEEDTAIATVHCSGANASGNTIRHIDQRLLRAPSLAADVGALYNGFDAVGLQYGPGFRTLVQAWGSTKTALARLRARLEYKGTQVHPADLDDALCTSGVITTSNVDGVTWLPFAVDDGLLQGGRPNELWAVRRSRLTEDCSNVAASLTTLLLPCP